MNQQNTPQSRLSQDTLIVTDDGSYTLHSSRYQQSYRSTNGALTEARHVFLEASGVLQRLQKKMPTLVLEVGFGLGLNLLLSSDQAAVYGTNLSYHSIEHDLVESQQIRQMNYAKLLEHSRLADELVSAVEHINQLQRNLQPRQADQSNGLLATDISADNIEPSVANEYVDNPAVVNAFKLGNNIEVVLHLQDATKMSFAYPLGKTFNAIYLDAFSPDTNSECWQPAFIQNLTKALAPGGKLSTYSAKGDVRRALLAAGLQVTKLPGPPGKREILVGELAKR